MNQQPSDQERAALADSLKRLDRIATLMDDQFELPIVRQRIGLDPIIGLIPGGGDWVVWLVSIYVFWEATRLGAPIRLLLKMAMNIGVDLLGGYTPVIGDVFDVVFKANRRNVEMLRAHFGAAPQLGSDLPMTIPEEALVTRSQGGLTRHAFALSASLLLLAVASGPFLLLYWAFTG